MSDSEEPLASSREVFSAPRSEVSTVDTYADRESQSLGSSFTSESYFMVRLLLLSKEVGCIIGKGGSTVKSLREMTHTRINISESKQGTFERVVIISGAVENLIVAIAIILDKLQEDHYVHRLNRLQTEGDSLNYGEAAPPFLKSLNTSVAMESPSLTNVTSCSPSKKRKTNSENRDLGVDLSEHESENLGESSLNLSLDSFKFESLETLPASLALSEYFSRREEPYYNGDIISVKVLIPHNQTGSLIGKSGTKIKEIREISGAQVSVSQDMLPNSTERAVILTGTAVSISKALAVICDIQLSTPGARGSTILYKPHTRLPPIYDYGCSAIPRATHPGLITCGAIPHPSSRFHSTHQPRSHSRLYSSVPLPFFSNACQPIQMNFGHIPAEQIMSIPNQMVGCIIGKGGTSINEIRQLSGATVKVCDWKSGTSERIISITGTPEQNQMACYLLNTKIQLEMNKNK